MKETEIGYRGSKSGFLTELVKEQRVDGSFCMKHKPMQIRYTLMGFERNYQLKYLSSQLGLYKKNYSTLKIYPNLNPYFVTGFLDAESTFNISIQKDKEYKVGWQVRPKFSISLHSRDLNLLMQLQEFFGGIGSLSKSKNRNSVSFGVSKLSDLINVIIPHFLFYPLLTQKAADFILFKRALELMNKKEHLTIEGLSQIINIRISMNWGISEQQKMELIKSKFKLEVVDRPKILTENIPDPNWIAGFTSGEGNFYVNVSESNQLKVGHIVQLKFSIAQHSKDLKLLEAIIKYLGAGIIEKKTNNSVVRLRITKISDINNIIIPLFEQCNIHGLKQFDYLDWFKVANLMSEGKHLTIEGLKEIRTIKSGMNKGRNLE